MDSIRPCEGMEIRFELGKASVALAKSAKQLVDVGAAEFAGDC